MLSKHYAKSIAKLSFLFAVSRYFIQRTGFLLRGFHLPSHPIVLTIAPNEFLAPITLPSLCLLIFSTIRFNSIRVKYGDLNRKQFI